MKGQGLVVGKFKKAFQPATSTVMKASVEETTTPQPSKMAIQHDMDDTDFRNEKLMLSDRQFNFIFMEPVNICPPSPTPSLLSESECPVLCMDVPFFDIETRNTESFGELDDLPPLNLSL